MGAVITKEDLLPAVKNAAEKASEKGIIETVKFDADGILKIAQSIKGIFETGAKIFDTAKSIAGMREEKKSERMREEHPERQQRNPSHEKSIIIEQEPETKKEEVKTEMINKEKIKSKLSALIRVKAKEAPKTMQDMPFEEITIGDLLQCSKTKIPNELKGKTFAEITGDNFDKINIDAILFTIDANSILDYAADKLCKQIEEMSK